MTFVLEIISDEDRKKYNLFGTEVLSEEERRNLYGAARFLQPSRWVVRREKNAYLYPAGGIGKGARDRYFLCWDNSLIEVVSQPQNAERKINEKGVFDVVHNLHWIKIPEKLLGEISIVKDLVKEALDAYGWCGSSERTNSVKIKNLDSVEIKLMETSQPITAPTPAILL